jgi:hypothetical protein
MSDAYTVAISLIHYIHMTFQKGKKDFRNSWENTKEAASDAASGVKNTAQGVGDELNEVVDGKDK